MRPIRALDRVVGGDPRVGRVVGAIIVAIFVQGIGASAVLPLLPLYLRRHGTSDGMVGAVIGAFFVAGVLTQYVAGGLTDRIGHRPVMLGGLGLYAAASLGFLTSVGTGGYVVLRAVQGVGSGAVQVASLALVGLVVPLERRGRAFSIVFAAELSGMAIGPLAGTTTGVGGLRWLFVASAAAAVLATVPIVVGTRQAPREVARATEVRAPLRVGGALVGVTLIGVAAGLVTGVYETCWSLLMNSRGAATWQIGLSWTLFAIPFAAVSPAAGRLVDRLDRRVLAVVATVAAAAFAATYPFLPSPAYLMGLGVAEAIGVAVAFPAAQSLLTQTVEPDALGRAQGFFSTAETAALAVMAAVSGALFGVARWVPFVTAAVLSLVCVLPLPVLWRGLRGRVVTVDDIAAGLADEVVATGAAIAGTPVER
ncbi:MAG: MFS transporter [Frankiales bacterium]|nr:MFS transporter [Frankiales bacterium]